MYIDRNGRKKTHYINYYRLACPAVRKAQKSFYKGDAKQALRAYFTIVVVPFLNTTFCLFFAYRQQI